MPEGEYENMQKSKEIEKSWKEIMEEKRLKESETDSDQNNNDGNK